MNGTTTRNGCARFPIGNMQNRNTKNNPSPDRLSNESQYLQSLSLLPHPRPKHNLREQLLWSTTSSPINYSRPLTNFPQPTSNSVAMRISALEKSTPLHINATQSPTTAKFPQQQTAPMSPRSTVFRTKPVLHMENALKVCFKNFFF